MLLPRKFFGTCILPFCYLEFTSFRFLTLTYLNFNQVVTSFPPRYVFPTNHADTACPLVGLLTTHRQSRGAVSLRSNQHVQYMSGKRRGVTRLQFHPMGSVPSDEEDADPSPRALLASFKHARLNRHEHEGLPGTRNSYVTGVASPKKVAVPSHSIPVWNEEPPLPEIDEETHPWLDPAYVHQLDTMDLEPAKRRRTDGVRQVTFFESLFLMPIIL